jgi:hypothetical protein
MGLVLMLMLIVNVWCCEIGFMRLVNLQSGMGMSGRWGQSVMQGGFDYYFSSNQRILFFKSLASGITKV